MGDERDFLFQIPLTGPIAALAEGIRAGTGRPELSVPPPALAPLIQEMFPDLPAPDSLEGCTDHPALIARLRIPGLTRERAKIVFRPRDDGLEVRVRAEVSAGPYRRETLLRLAHFLADLERAIAPGIGTISRPIASRLEDET